MARIWPDVVGKSIRSGAAKWQLSGGAEDQARVRATLMAFWGKRLDAISSLSGSLGLGGGEWISAQGRERIALLANQGTGVLGYEFVEAAAKGDAEGYWFFDLGVLSWMQLLVSLRAGGHPLWSNRADLVELERIWAKEGASGARAFVAKMRSEITTDLALVLYGIPLALWAENNPGEALRLIDHVQRLDGPTREALGTIVPLSAALAHAMSGRAGMAAKLLSPANLGAVAERNEIRYQRARYLWDTDNRTGQEARRGTSNEALFSSSGGAKSSDEMALEILERVIRDEQGYLARFLSDPAWQNRDQRGQGAIRAFLERLQGDARGALLRWQQVDRSGALVPREIVAFQENGNEPVLSMVAGLAARKASSGQGPVVDEARMHANFERVRAYYAAIPGGPGGIEFKLEGQLGLPELERAIVDRRFDEAERRIARIEREAPYIVKLGLVSFGGQLARALQDSGQLLQTHGSGAMATERIKTCATLLTRVGGLVEPIKDLPSGMGQDAIKALGGIGSRFHGVVTTWGKDIEEHVGRLKLVVRGAVGSGMGGIDGGIIRVPGNDFVPVQVMVQDASGQGVMGIPVIWKIASGPALVRSSEGDLETGLSNGMTVSAANGTVFLPIQGAGRGGDGVVEARVLGQKTVFTLPYSVIADRIVGAR